jgi:hypothetical protein
VPSTCGPRTWLAGLDPGGRLPLWGAAGPYPNETGTVQAWSGRRRTRTSGSTASIGCCRSIEEWSANQTDQRSWITVRPSAALDAVVPDALFVGGGTGGGKTTLARLLAARHGLRLLQVDHFWYAHAERAGDIEPPPDVQWLEWSPATQAADFERISRQMLRFVLEDLPTLPDQPAVVVEGPQIIPDLLPPGARAVFLTPTPEFQRRVLTPRPMPSSDPGRALGARLVKDRLHADRVATAAGRCGFLVIEVDGKRAPDLICSQVEIEFMDLLRRSEPRDLAGVRRWENEVMAANLRGWIASGDSLADMGVKVPFTCECGRAGCTARVDLTMAQFEAVTASVLAPGHRPDGTRPVL